MKTQKQFSLSLFLVLFFAQIVGAQVVLTSQNLPVAGDTIIFAIDDEAGVLNLGSSGANQVWDFSQLVVRDRADNIYLDPAETPFAEQFPNATLSFIIDLETPAYSYLRETTDTVLIQGLTIEVEELGGNQIVNFDDEQIFALLPTQLGTQYLDTASFSFSFVEPETQSELTLKTVQYSNIDTDAEGEVMLPGGTYPALRQRVITERIDSLFFTLFGQPNFFDREISVDTLYLWFSPASKGLLVTIDGDNSVTYYAPEVANIQAPTANFNFVTSDTGAIQFTDLSSNMPISWTWDFGDGNSSNVQNPIHQYDSSGMYTVCLVVENVGGIDTLCQEVAVMVTSIDNLPAGAEFSLFPNPAKDQLTFRLLNAGALQPQIVIYNAQGQRQQTAVLNQQLSLPVNDWSSGLYYYQLMDRGRLLKTGKFVVQ